LGTRARLKGARRIEREKATASWLALPEDVKRKFHEVVEKIYELTPGLSESEQNTLISLMLIEGEEDYEFSPEIEALRAPLREICKAIQKSDSIMEA
jgi:hypothetical protein